MMGWTIFAPNSAYFWLFLKKKLWLLIGESYFLTEMVLIIFLCCFKLTFSGLILCYFMVGDGFIVMLFH